jgi:hypothetical protein
MPHTHLPTPYAQTKGNTYFKVSLRLLRFASSEPLRYLHNSPAAGLGSLATIVGLVTGGGDPAAPKAQAALKAAAKTVAMHIAAAKPLYATVAEVSQVGVGLPRFEAGIGTCCSSVAFEVPNENAFAFPLHLHGEVGVCGCER